MVKDRRIGTLIAAVVIMLACASLAQASIVGQSGSDWYLENEHLKMTVKPASGYIMVYDKATNKSWAQPGAVTHRAFTDVATYGLTDGLGFWTTFRDSSAGSINMFVQLILPTGSRNLQVTVNISNADTTIGGFDFLEPFTLTTSTSYIIAPDHCDGRLYPTDISSWPISNLDLYAVASLDMPWLGVIDLSSGQGYSVIVDTPYDATFKCIKFSGRRAPLVRWEPQKGKFGYLRSMIISFTATGGYVGLAKAYRAYALSRGQIITLASKAAQNPNVAKTYGAACVWDWYCSVPVKALKAAGVDKCIYHGEVANSQVYDAKAAGYVAEEYDTYVDAAIADSTHLVDSYYDIYPDHFAKNQDGSTRLGWVAGTRGPMYRRCPEFYIPTARSVIPARLASLPMTGRYMDVHTQTQSDLDGDIEECWDPAHPKTRTQWEQDHYDLFSYVRNLGLVISAEHGRWWAVPKSDVFYGIMGGSGWPWAGFGHPTVYGQTDYGSQGTVPASQWSTYETWGTLGTANRVPLWELVFHDCVSTTYYPWDVNDWSASIPNDWYQTKKDTLNVLYATPPIFFSSASPEGSWYWNRRAFMDSCRAGSIHGALAEKEMLTHEFLTPDHNVQKTTWSDGTQIIVNFGTQDYFADVGFKYSQMLKQFCWAVKGPSIEASKSYYYDPARIVTYIKSDGYYYHDEQVSNGKPVPLATRRVNAHMLRVNADYTGVGMTFIIQPGLVASNWDYKTTHVFRCDKNTGSRIEQIPWTPVGNWGIQVGPFNDWTVLDVVCGIRRDDFDGDNKTDLALFSNTSPVKWSTFLSASGFTALPPVSWGDAVYGDIPISGDYDGDGKSDWIVYRPGSNTWLINTQASKQAAVSMPGSSGTPISGDFDCDGITDFGICTAGTPMQWIVLLSSSNYTSTKTGSIGSAKNYDIPVPGDYDGDGTSDFAVYHPASTSRWYVLYSATNMLSAYNLGKVGSIPVSGDYDGDGKTDFCVCTPGTPMLWTALLSSSGFISTAAWTLGGSKLGDVPLCGDFDGDGKNDCAVYSAGNPGHLIIMNSMNGNTVTYFCGADGDRPVPLISNVTPPVINSITVNPSLAALGDTVHVTLNASGNLGLSYATADGSPLTWLGFWQWAGDMAVQPNIGMHTVNITVRDVAGNVANSTGSYKTGCIVGTSIRGLRDAVMRNASANYLFRVWGRAAKVDANTFTLDDGSGVLLNVTATTQQVNTGDYIAARGTVVFSSGLPVLLSDPDHIEIVSR